MTDQKFSVSPFKNRNGSTTWRVSGWLAGVRIRRNLKTREEAAVEKASLEIRAVQLAAGIRSATTFLEDSQLREAEAAFQRLKDKPRSLSFYLDYALANYRETEHTKPLTDAVDAYLEARGKDHNRKLLSASMLKQIRWELDALKRRFPDETLAQFTPQNLGPFLERGCPSLKSYNNRRGLVLTFFKFAQQQDWLVANPVAKLPHYRIAHRRGSAVTLTIDECARLMDYVETVAGGKMVPYFALCLFAGIRPSVHDGEISKLLPEHIRLDTGMIMIEPEVSKVRMKRMVTIQPNLAAWLRAYPFEAISANTTEHLRRKIARKFKLTHDVLRHTFISMFVGKFRSLGEAALQAGNSESIIRKHYLDLKTTEEAEEFFNIVPKHRTVVSLTKTSEMAVPSLRLAV